MIVEIKKIRQETFALYESTATGSVTDTIAGKSLFRQPKILLFMAALAIGSVVYDGGPRCSPLYRRLLLELLRLLKPVLLWVLRVLWCGWS